MNETEPIDDPPFRLMSPPPRKPVKKCRKPGGQVISKASLEILANYIHREDFTREELARRFGLTIRQLRKILKEQGWERREGEDDDETNLPTMADPVPCPFPPGSEGKIWILEERYARRFELFNPRDRIHPEAEAERLAKKPKPKRKPPAEPTPEELDAIELELSKTCQEDPLLSRCLLPSSEISKRKPPINSPV